MQYDMNLKYRWVSHEYQDEDSTKSVIFSISNSLNYILS